MSVILLFNDDEAQQYGEQGGRTWLLAIIAQPLRRRANLCVVAHIAAFIAGAS